MAHQAPNDSTYTVMARRFRPQTFDEVVGQNHVAQALRNAIRGNRVAHAYLFTGARGVGKTSTARIFAKALNCPSAVDALPCNECDVCEAISAGQDVDVLEIDGASNRGIDDIRTLRANVNVRSMRSKYKVYIIDEVHMLTKEAFNALLKTLEEPPPNVKFVFCTTEPNKVPDTILSRCQRFDFGMIGATTIGARLEQIAAIEGMKVSPEAVALVARRGAGSMRDAQSLFDQLLSFGSDEIATEDVHRLLGTAPDERIIELVDALIAADAGKALSLADAALGTGGQLASLSDQLIEYLRDLMVAAVGADGVALASVSDRWRDRLREQVKEWGIETVAASMQILAETKFRMGRVNYGRSLLELALVRICLLERLDSLRGTLHELTSGAPAKAPSATIAAQRRSVSAERRIEAPAPPVAAASPVASLNAPLAATVGETAGEESGEAEQPQDFLELTSATVTGFWSQVLVRSNDVLRGHLKNASPAAISGPNAVEIVFPASYSFSKTYCERPESLRKLSEIAREITGQSIGFRISGQPAAGENGGMKPAVSKPGRTATGVKRQLDAVAKDPFVQQALAVFGGKIVDCPVIESRREDG